MRKVEQMSDFSTIKQWEDCRELTTKFAGRNGFKTELTPTRFVLDDGKGQSLHFCSLANLTGFIRGYEFLRSELR